MRELELSDRHGDNGFMVTSLSPAAVIGLALVGGLAVMGALHQAGQREHRQVEATTVATTRWAQRFETMQQRYRGKPDSDTLADAGFPSRAQWDRCVADQTPAAIADAVADESCAQVVAWMVRMPPVSPTQGLSLVAALAAQPGRWFGARAGQEPLVVSWVAQTPEAALPTEAIPIVAASFHGVLGSPVDQARVGEAVRASLRGLRRWRGLMATRCGDCAPSPSALPVPDTKRSEMSIDIAAERIHRASVSNREPASAPVQLAAKIRAGGDPTETEWAQPGLAGVAAFELLRARRKDMIDTLLRTSAVGPSASDRLAALYAAIELSESADVLRLSAQSPDAKRGLERALQLLSNGGGT